MNLSVSALLTVNEAAHTAGVSPSTVRAWIHRAKRGTLRDADGNPLTLRTTRDARGRTLIAETDLLDIEYATRTTTRGRPRRAPA
ncbi:hypothetical protein H9L10_03610 [Phycicoccus endophyticus]|uniref:Helix-turn-helix domain-containing protein n=1 Tax=Phycicoccus endophyticus TaxID=1690220 RepID=A0A7G9R3I1_9MICO|nr:helix-turn-helix domain-containing protein [Phycicoccus endophyticus]NHI19912.1 helix-turn-helix domain-containing protein [Phycicoccus endophyticus]QNN50156.1 hypothetical protein H9L10_03610 [Phycicoccus endophyticus]GGL27578.1 hypothetical protein GCM10012283_07210 [Phycicoccus endophyticus]